jgi:hypothetical protein
MATIGINPAPVRIRVSAISTSNLTLSGPQTADTVALTAGMLCGALGQSDNKSGVYLVQAGAWLPVNPGFGTGLEVYATGGSANVNAVYGCDTTGAITWGTTSTAFTLKSSASGAAVNASTVTISGAPAASASGKVSLGTESQTSVQYLAINNPTGDIVDIGIISASGTSKVRKAFACYTLANDAVQDITNGGYGGVAVISSGTIVATIGIAASTYATTTGGQTYTNFSTTLTTANKLNVNASGGALRFENKTGGSISIVVDFTFFVTA